MSTVYMAKGDSNGNSKEVYSTDEILTGGIWIDNKPIYRKVLNFTLNVNGFIIIDIGSLGIETTISNNAILIESSGFRVSEFNYYQNSPIQNTLFSSYMYNDEGAKVLISHRIFNLTTGVFSTTQASRPGYLILEYTKL